jgi:3-oxoacyl-[acyl-carrier protein] reductase
MADEPRRMVITGTRKGLGKYLVEHYSRGGWEVIGCSRQAVDYDAPSYRHYCLDVADETAVGEMFAEIGRDNGRLDVLINNAGIASMNHVLLTPLSTVAEIFKTNVLGTYLFSRQAARLMSRRRFGRIVNMVTVATPLKLEGEAAYASSKAAVVSLTEIMARELSELGITVNAVGPGPLDTDLTRKVRKDKIDKLLGQLAIRHLGEMADVTNVIDFLIAPESGAVTGQTIYLGGA